VLKKQLTTCVSRNGVNVLVLCSLTVLFSFLSSSREWQMLLLLCLLHKSLLPISLVHAEMNHKKKMQKERGYACAGWIQHCRAGNPVLDAKAE